MEGKPSIAVPSNFSLESGSDSKDRKQVSKRRSKNLIVAYLCWAIGGIAGLHHFYLGRMSQGFVWWTTGGGFVLGYIRDSWRLSDYVKQSNLDPEFVKSFFLQSKWYKQPEFRGTRFLGMVTTGMFYGYLAQFSLPENCFGLGMNEHKLLWILVVPLGIAFGNYIVGNIGYEEVSFKWCLTGATAPALFLPLNPDMTSYCALFSTVIASWKREFRKSVYPNKVSLFTWIVVFLGILVYASMWISLFYFNVSVVTKEGDRMYFRDMVSSYFEEDFEILDVLNRIRTDSLKFLHDIRTQVHSFRLLEDTEAYTVLGLDWGAPEEEVTARYRELAKKYHPDKTRGLDLETSAEYTARMVDITRAYESLTKKKKGRKNLKRNQGDPLSSQVGEKQDSSSTANSHSVKEEL